MQAATMGCDRGGPGRWGLMAMAVVLGTALSNGCAQPSGTTGDGSSQNGDPVDNANGNDNGPPDGGGASTPTLTFAVIGDYGADDDDTREVADLVKSWQPDFIITTGDNDYSDGAFRGTFKGLELGVGQYFHEFIGSYQGNEGPGADQNRFFPTPGDHDWGDTCEDAGGLDDYLGYFTLPADLSGNERYYEFRRGPVHFFSVHSLEGCEPDGVTADSAQARWVRETALASDAAFKVAYFHNPPYSSGDRHIGDGEHMRWPWNDWGFDLVLSGDDHIYERIDRDGLTYVVNGLGGVEQHGLVDEPVEGSVVRYVAAFGAMRVAVFDKQLEIAFESVGGEVIDRFTIGSNGGGMSDPPATDGDWYRPTVETTWQWQLQPDADGGINANYNADVYDLDLFDVPDGVIEALQADGRRVICYFSAGSYEAFREDAGEFDPDADLGNPLEVFDDERWLDVRSDNVRRIMLQRLDLAAARGCDGVEPDNVDGYDNDPGFDFTEADQVAFNRFLADAAHDRGLAVGLKNDLPQIPALVDSFDFSVNEQCHEYDECDLLLPFIEAGKPVFNAEYADRFVDDAQGREALCQEARTLGLRTLVLPLDLDDAFRFSCDP